MASVIRVNTINSRSGLSTVTFDNSGAGVEVAGIVTATSVVSSGAVSGTTGTFSGALSVAQDILHTGDTDTKIVFTNNQIDFHAHNSSRLYVNQYAIYVQTGYPLAFLSSSGATPNIKSGGTNNQDLLLTTGTSNPTRLQIKSDGKVLVGSGCTDASTFNVKGSAGFADDGTNAGLIISTDDANGAALSCLTAGGFVGGSYGVMRLNALQHKFTYGNTVRLNIKNNGDIETDGNLKSNNLPGRNLIINGDFQIAQRATTNNTTGAQSTYHTLDRWLTQIQSGTITESQQSLSSSDTGPWQKGFRKYMRMQNNGTPIGAGAAQYAEIDQRIEAQNIAQSGWDYTDSAKYITLSFWARASVAQNYIVNMYANDGTNRHFPHSFALSANTWTKVTKSIPGYSGITVNNDNGNGATIAFIASYGTNYTSNSGTFDTWNTTGNGLNRWPDMTTTWATTANATFDITGVQLEVGTIATEFEHKSYDEELALCQRYYLKTPANSASYLPTTNASDHSRLSLMFPVTMRAVPQATMSSYTLTATTHGVNGYQSSGSTDTQYEGTFNAEL